MCGRTSFPPTLLNTWPLVYVDSSSFEPAAGVSITTCMETAPALRRSSI
jgi:hypothetical protein